MSTTFRPKPNGSKRGVGVVVCALNLLPCFSLGRRGPRGRLRMTWGEVAQGVDGDTYEGAQARFPSGENSPQVTQGAACLGRSQWQGCLASQCQLRFLSS